MGVHEGGLVTTPEEDLNVIYDNTLDGGRFRLRVIRQADRLGYLTVTREEDGTVLDEGEVPLAYGAIFGPDADDVHQWQERTIKAVDKFNGVHTE
jgi:hypothetical protein